MVFDPFCGSGVTLLQSGTNGYESIGFDINPLALLIARAKTQTYREEKLLREFESLKKTVYQNASPLFNDDDKIDVPKIKNRDYWYSKSVIDDLGRIRFVLKNNSYKYKDFFMANFAFICRDQSLTRKGEFKRYRLNKEKIAKAKNEVLTRFFSHTQKMTEVFLNTDIPKKKSRPILANSENKIPEKIKYDLVITSPPYGDSRTTVAYGQYSSFGSEWINNLNGHAGNSGYSIDREGLGKESQLSGDLNNYKSLTEVVEKIKNVDPKRANEVMFFFNGYYKAIRNIIGNLNKKGRVCFVVGNRTVKGFQIPMDQITASFLDDMGLSFEGIFIRDILNKVMPSRNSPSNKTGEKSRTMTHEYIVVFSKG